MHLNESRGWRSLIVKDNAWQVMLPCRHERDSLARSIVGAPPFNQFSYCQLARRRALQRLPDLLILPLFYGLAGRSLAQHELIDGHAVLARIHFSTENLDPVRRECARQIGKQAVTI